MRLLENGDAIRFGKQQIQNQNIRLVRGEHRQRLFTVRCNAYDVISAGLFQQLFQMAAKLIVSICDQNLDAIFHMLSSPVIMISASLAGADEFIAATTIM